MTLPNEPPNSNESISKEHNKYSFFWKVFFITSALLMALILTGLPLVEELSLSLFDYIDIVLSVIITVGLFGFAYSKAIASVVFWRYFFYVVLFETIMYNFLFPLLGIKQFGNVSQIDAWIIVEIGYVYLFLYALHTYAYRRPYIWR